MQNNPELKKLLEELRKHERSFSAEKAISCLEKMLEFPFDDYNACVGLLLRIEIPGDINQGNFERFKTKFCAELIKELDDLYRIYQRNISKGFSVYIETDVIEGKIKDASQSSASYLAKIP